MAGLRDAQKKFTRSRLLEAGLQLFEEKGYAVTTVDDITAKAGANRTTFYLHFASKSELMLGLIDEINAQIISSDVPRLTTVVEGGDKNELREWVSRRFTQWPKIMPYVMAAEQAVGLDPDIRRGIDAWHASAISEIIDGLTRSGRFDEDERRARAVLAFAQVEYVSRRWARHGWDDFMQRDVMLESLTQSMHSLLVQGAP